MVIVFLSIEIIVFYCIVTALITTETSSTAGHTLFVQIVEHATLHVISQLSVEISKTANNHHLETSNRFAGADIFLPIYQKTADPQQQFVCEPTIYQQTRRESNK